MPQTALQDYLFQKIKELLPAEVSLVDVVAQLLFLSQDSAYRRIRGETLLVLEETKILCDKFDISLDRILQTSDNSVIFRLFEVEPGKDSFLQFLRGILNQLQILADGNDRQIIYLSKELVVFRSFLFKPLFSFQYLFWMKSVVGDSDIKSEYSLDVITPELEAVANEIIRLYYQIPSIEILNTECINSIIVQVEYYRDAGIFRSEQDVQQVYDSLQQHLQHLWDEAEAGIKFMPGENPSFKKKNFQLFYNRIGLADNTILGMKNNRRAVYLNYEILNYMMTTDENFCEKTEQKLQSIIRQSTLLSDFNTKQRDMFFNTLIKKIPQRLKLSI
jgi:hypothetical protein